jgi:hypothetical protein
MGWLEAVAARWEKLQATPGLTTLVLDVGGDAMGTVPEVDPAAFGDPEADEQRRQQIDRLWQQHAGSYAAHGREPSDPRPRFSAGAA